MPAQTRSAVLLQLLEQDLDRPRDETLDENTLLRQALEWMPVGFCMLDSHDSLQLCNQRFIDLWKLPLSCSMRGTTYRQLIEASGAVEILTAENARKRHATDGSRRREWSMPDGRIMEVFVHMRPDGSCVALHEDISARHVAESRLAWLAGHDDLTGLANRTLLRQSLERAIDPENRVDDCALLSIDLDGFKHVNDTLGHPVGDRLLREVALRLENCCRSSDLVARLGGDEFAVLVTRMPFDSSVARQAERILKALTQTFRFDDSEVRIGASIGTVLAPRDGLDVDTLLANADVAMYRAKADGRGAVVRFEAGMDGATRERRWLAQDLRVALEYGQLELAFQPQVALTSRRIVGTEALLRWNHPRLGRVPPSQFIPLAEQTRLIVPIGRWVMQAACRCAATWSQPLRVAVNVSVEQFRDDSLLDDVVQALASSGLPAQRLEIEITESVIMENDTHVRKVLSALRDLGVSLAMDDFGTGYSSLSHLRRLPFDRLKIDRSFVNDIESQPDALIIVRAIMALSESLGLSVTVEGVETEAQHAIISREACHAAQGYLYGKPCSKADLDQLLLGS